MDSVVIDTCVFSYILKKDTRAELYRQHIDGKAACLSFMTVAELYRWAVERRWGNKRTGELRNRLRRYIVVPYDDSMAWEWARVKTIKGKPISGDDAWIAATAIRHDLPLITHNPTHFEHIPHLRVISESDGTVCQRFQE